MNFNVFNLQTVLLLITTILILINFGLNYKKDGLLFSLEKHPKVLKFLRVIFAFCLFLVTPMVPIFFETFALVILFIIIVEFAFIVVKNDTEDYKPSKVVDYSDNFIPLLKKGGINFTGYFGYLRMLAKINNAIGKDLTEDNAKELVLQFIDDNAKYYFNPFGIVDKIERSEIYPALCLYTSKEIYILVTVNVELVEKKKNREVILSGEYL